MGVEGEKWVTERAAKSGEIVRWLLDYCPGGMDEIKAAVRYEDRWQRRWLEWQNNPDIRVSVETTLDSFLCVLGVPLSAAPDYIFGDPRADQPKKGRKNLPPKEQAAAIRYAKKNGTAAAAKKYGVTSGAVRYWLRKDREQRGEAPASRVNPATEKAARMRLANPHMTYAEISRQTGAARSSIRRQVNKLLEAENGVS